MNELLKVDIAEKRFGEQRLYRDAVFVAHEGETIAITGESGSGKTTLLRILSGLDPHYEGVYRYRGEEVKKQKAFRRIKARAAFVFQSVDLIDHLTVMENILLPFSFRKGKVDEKELSSLLETLSLQGKEDRLAARLSLGEKQRVAIARAFLTRPEIVFADEPTGSLDDNNVEMVMSLLLGLCKTANATLVMVTHRKSLLPLFSEVYEIKDETIRKMPR